MSTQEQNTPDYNKFITDQYLIDRGWIKRKYVGNFIGWGQSDHEFVKGDMILRQTTYIATGENVEGYFLTIKGARVDLNNVKKLRSILGGKTFTYPNNGMLYEHDYQKFVNEFRV